MPRTTLEYSGELEAKLMTVAREDGRTKAEVFRRALSQYFKIREETQNQDRKIAVIDRNGKIIKELVFIF
ncbi:TPA: hypothetical protein DF272_06965 [Candidatus Falkowbacteria bacterium]|nr:hypothetical protein [Candidatus Falkowbacteria bacterium]